VKFIFRLLPWVMVAGAGYLVYRMYGQPATGVASVTPTVAKTGAVSASTASGTAKGASTAVAKAMTGISKLVTDPTAFVKGVGTAVVQGLLGGGGATHSQMVQELERRRAAAAAEKAAAAVAARIKELGARATTKAKALKAQTT
jgi:hypothetical protein